MHNVGDVAECAAAHAIGTFHHSLCLPYMPTHRFTGWSKNSGERYFRTNAVDSSCFTVQGCWNCGIDWADTRTGTGKGGGPPIVCTLPRVDLRRFGSCEQTEGKLIYVYNNTTNMLEFNTNAHTHMRTYIRTYKHAYLQTGAYLQF